MHKFEVKDYLTAIAVILGMAVHWGTFQQRMASVEKAILPVPQMHTDIEVVKAAVLDIRDDLRGMRRVERPR